MALSGDNPFIAIDPATGLPKPGQDVPVPKTEAEIARWFAIQEAWAAFNRNGDTRLLREVGLLPSKDSEPAQEQEENKDAMSIVELICQAPWREAVTYRETWPHEYVVIKKDGQQELLAEVCKRFCAGEGVSGKFFSRVNEYLFIGNYKYWLMTPCTEIDLEKDDYVLNRALIYRDRRDFLIKDGDDGRRNTEIDDIFGVKPSEYNKGAKANDDSLTGKLENVDVKSIWPTESHDFTHWLKRNITQLDEALKMDLELVEAQPDDFPLDILAKDKFSGATVAIENQLEITTHWDLGHILNYAGGHDARVLVWVTPDLRPEHRDALDWLNRWTPDQIEVYGVEVRAVQIGDSKPAPEFVPVVLTNAWSTRAKAKSAGLGLVGFKNREFFQPLVDKLRKAGFTDKHTAHASTFQPFPSGLSDMDYVASLENNGMAWVYIPGGTPNLDALRQGDECRQQIRDELALKYPKTQYSNWRTCLGTGSLGVYRKGSLDDS